jgi:hypothetical protein
MRQAIRVGTYTGLAGLVIALIFLLASHFRQSPLGPGENIEWVLTALLILGYPTSLAAVVLHPMGAGPTLVSVVMILAVALNWALLGFLAAILMHWIRSALRSSTE